VLKTAIMGHGAGVAAFSCAGTSPRSREDTHPTRISAVRNVITPLASGSGQSVLRKEGTRRQGEEDGRRSERHHAERRREAITG